MEAYLHIAADVVSVLVLLFFGGRFVGRLEANVTRITALEAHISKVVERLRHHVESEHPELAQESKSIEIELAELRASRSDPEERSRR